MEITDRDYSKTTSTRSTTKKGKENQAADVLSRVNLSTEELEEYGQQQNSTPWTQFVVWEATKTPSIFSYVATDKQDVILTPREIFDEEQWINHLHQATFWKQRRNKIYITISEQFTAQE